MTNPDEVFVKIFRNKEVWNQRESSFEASREKLNSEIEYRKKLAVEAGIEPERIEPKFNHHIDAKLFYPEFDYDSPEYVAWRYGSTEKTSVAMTKEQTESGDRDCGWPTEVLEEKALFKKRQVFEADNYFNLHSSEDGQKWRIHHRLLYGVRGQKRYLVAWWGEKKYYDEIQKKLEELRNPPAPAPVIAPEMPAPKTGRTKTKPVSIFGAALCLFMLGAAVYWGTWGDKNSPEVLENTTTGEVASQEMITPYECATLFLKASTDAPGIVLGKREIRCRDHGKHWLVDVKTDNNWVSLLLVSEEVFNKIKFGDRLPDVLERKERKEY